MDAPTAQGLVLVQRIYPRQRKSLFAYLYRFML